MSVASGRSRDFTAPIASSEISRAPLVAIMTGSITFAISECGPIASAMTSIAAGSASIPVLSALMSYTPRTASSCAFTKSAGTVWIADTSRGFCAVSAANTVHPCSEYAWNALRSACTPAFPPESLPAIVRQHGEL